MPRLGENSFNQVIWLLDHGVKRTDVAQRSNVNVSTMTCLQNHYTAFCAVAERPDAIPTSLNFGIGSKRPPTLPGDQSKPRGM